MVLQSIHCHFHLAFPGILNFTLVIYVIAQQNYAAARSAARRGEARRIATYIIAIIISCCCCYYCCCCSSCCHRCLCERVNGRSARCKVVELIYWKAARERRELLVVCMRVCVCVYVWMLQVLHELQCRQLHRKAVGQLQRQLDMTGQRYEAML